MGSGAEAEAFRQALEPATFAVGWVEAKPAKRNPYPPFTTSTLQQEASRKLGFAPAHTMRLAQRLYEGADIGGETVGLITYMRTDGVQIAEEAIAAIRHLIDADYGARYVPNAPSPPPSTSPSRRRAIRKPRWSSAWRSSASGGRRPTRRSCRCCRIEAMCVSTRNASCPTTEDAC